VRLNFHFRFGLYAAFAVLVVSGALWLVADGLKDAPDGETWQAISANLLMLHGGAAMITLMLLGALGPLHVLRSWRAKKNRLTGGTMVAVNAVLVITAFGLYYLGSELLRPSISNVHLISGFLLPFLLGLHIVQGRRARLKSQVQRGCAKATPTHKLVPSEALRTTALSE
jgi:hypothetical protein